MIVEITSTLEQFSTHLTSIALDLGGDRGRDLGGDLVKGRTSRMF